MTVVVCHVGCFLKPCADAFYRFAVHAVFAPHELFYLAVGSFDDFAVEGVRTAVCVECFDFRLCHALVEVDRRCFDEVCTVVQTHLLGVVRHVEDVTFYDVECL